MAASSDIQCLIVDDEYPALLLVEDYVKKAGGITIVDKCKSAVKAAEVLSSKKIDLLFLDINMPNLKGTELLKMLPEKPVTIFTTAYSEFAVDAFELDAVDYLVKPFSFERFLKAVLKAKELIQSRREGVAVNETQTVKKNFITMKSEHRLVKIPLDDICYVEGFQEYVKIIMEKETVIVYERMKNMEALLPSDQFVRAHKSYIVSKGKVKSFTDNHLEINAAKIPVSRENREAVLREIFG